MTDEGFDASVLCEFRARLLAHQAEQRLFEHLVEQLQQRGWIKKRGMQRTDSTHVRKPGYQAGVLAVPVSHPQQGMALWLVVSRPGKGRPPWYLLTNEPIWSEQDAWQVVFAYARRGPIEMCWRVNKSELAFESPRLWTWEGRVKLLLIAALAYAFLLTLLDPAHEKLRDFLLRWWCHRTGKRSQETSTPLYRLRWAISRLWLAFDPALAFSFPQKSEDSCLALSGGGNFNGQKQPGRARPVQRRAEGESCVHRQAEP